MKTFGLNLHQRIELRFILSKMRPCGSFFTFFSQTKVTAWRDCNGHVWVNLPGIYRDPVNMASLGYNL